MADWVPTALVPFWEVLSGVPLMAALFIAGTFFLLALFLRFTVFRSLARLASATHTDIDDQVIRDLRKPLFTTVLFFGLTLAVEVAELPFGRNAMASALVSVIVASWMRALLKVSSSVLETIERQHRFRLIEPRTLPLIDLTAKLLTLLVGSYALLMIWGINPIGWLASAGIVGIAVGFAAKDTLANLFSGFFIVADAPYKLGDYINLDTGERGKVSAIGLRSTRLLTRDDVEITIPNGVIASAKIVNESGGPYVKIRAKVPIGVAYGSDVDQVCAVLIQVGQEHPETAAHPEPRARLRAFGDSSLDFDLLVWIEHPEDRGRIRHDLLMATYKALGAAGIEIPYPKQDVYVKELPRPD